MHFIRLILSESQKNYLYNGASNIQMNILGDFLTSDVRCSKTIFRTWALRDDWYSGSGNITAIDKEDGYVYLSDLYSQEKVPTKLKMTVQQFIQLLDDWQEKVCKAKPQEVIIKYEDGEFVIETSNEA